MRSYPRSYRVGTRIQEELSELLLKNIKDPRLEMVTISHVKMTSDLRLAKVYYSVVGDEKRKKDVAEGLARARGFIKREMAARLGLRYMPDINFFYDESFDYGSRIESILNKLDIPHSDEAKASEGTG